MGTNDSMLHKVRALLAKAEATPFEAEAEAFTAKAQELIVRYRIDRALVDARESRGPDTPVARRVAVEDPYLTAKVVLLSTVARSNDCRAVWPKPLRYVQLFGRADDLDAVEELFTSLLLQATVALRRAGSKQDGFGRSRTAAFRRAFLMSFAHRIGHRLRETVDATVGAAAALAAQSFPLSRPLRATVSDAEGWHAGSAFADQADLATSPKLARGA